MIDNDLMGLTFSALRTLVLVHRHRSFSAAATELDVKQSTVSYNIGRLRAALGDPLFVRQGNSIVPTERGIEAVRSAERILAEIEDLAAATSFDPGAAVGSVSVACNYYARMTFLGDLVRDLRRDAPGLTLHFVSGFDAGDILNNSRAEIAITPIPYEGKGIFGKIVTRDNPVCLMDPSNPLAQGPISLEAYCAASHAYIEFGGGMRTVMERELLTHQLRLRKVVTLPDPAALPNLIRGTDLIATLPSRFAAMFAQDLATSAAPTKWQTEIYMYWPARLDRSPLNRWVRDRIERAAAALPKLERY